jgi:hypothetical protein
MKKVCEMVKRISGKSQPSATHHLLVNDNKIEHPKDIANTLASTISFSSSHEHYSESFEKSRVQQEKRPLNFNSDNSEYYNELFSLSELQDALRQCHDTAVGPGEIHNKMLGHQTPFYLHCFISGKLVASHCRGRKRPSFLYRNQTKITSIPAITDQ